MGFEHSSKHPDGQQDHRSERGCLAVCGVLFSHFTLAPDTLSDCSTHRPQKYILEIERVRGEYVEELLGIRSMIQMIAGHLECLGGGKGKEIGSNSCG
jgi:hypothetical protein